MFAIATPDILGPKDEDRQQLVVRGPVKEPLRKLSFTEENADGGGNDERLHEGYIAAFVLGYAETTQGIGRQIQEHQCEQLVGAFTKNLFTIFVSK